jgi:sugar phosphate isomerase/epimerase
MSAAGATSARRLKRVGIQLWSLRDAAKVNLDKTLGDIAAIGYTDVELLMSGNNFGNPPKRVRAMLDRHGLRAPSSHIDPESLPQLDRVLDDASILGHKYLFVANLPDEARKSLDSFRAFADRINRAGEAARKHDIWLGVHDEPDDFVKFGDKVGYDALVAGIDPKVVRLQFDIGNCALGGQDPLAYIKRYGDLYWAFHVKDAPKIPSKDDAELGKGILDFRTIFQHIKNIDHKYLYVEQETYPGAPIDSARRNYAYISKLKF